MIKTFIVEDSPVIRESLTVTLEELAPVEVVGSAEDEPAALAWLGAPDHRADLVIIDLFLPRGSGLGVLQGLKAQPSHGRLIVLSNYATPDMRGRCLELGADRVFDKSHDIDALLDYCRSLADHQMAAPAGRA